MYTGSLQLLLLIISFFFIELILILTKSFTSPINLIVFYWYLWQFVSIVFISVGFLPSVEIYFFHIVFLLGLVLGTIAYKVLKKKGIHVSPQLQLTHTAIITKNAKILYVFFVLIFPYTLYLFVNSIRLISSDYVGLRGSLVSMENNPLFSSVLVNYFYYVVLNGLWTLYALYACVLFFTLNQKKHIIIILMYALMLSGIYFNRAYLYYFFIFVVWSYVLLKIQNKGITAYWKLSIAFFRDVLVNKKIRVFALILVALLGAIQVQSVLRAESGGKNKEGVFLNTLIKYHVAGLVLFDLELQDESSDLNANQTYGLGVFGGVEQLFALFIKQINRDYRPVVAREALSEFQVIGVDKYGKAIRSNALYNIVYTLVRDGGYFPLFFVAFFIGHMSAKHYNKWSSNSSCYSYGIAIFLFSLLTTSFIRSNLELTSYWICIVLLLSAPRISKLR